MAIRINDNSSGFSGRVRATLGSFSPGFAGTYTAPGAVTFEGSINRSLGKFTASFTEGNNHPKFRNAFGIQAFNSINTEFFVNTSPLYLVMRCADYVQAQELGWFTAAERASQLPKFQAVIEANPYIWMSIHDSPFANNPLFRTRSNSKHHFRYEYVAQNRGDAIVYIDHDNLDEVPVNRETNTTLVTKQAGYQLNIANQGVSDRMGNLMADYVSGSNYSGESLGGLDLSENVGWMFDGSPYVNPKSGAQLLNTQAKGSIVSIVSSNSQQPIEIELDSQPNLSTTGTLAEDASYGAVDNIDSIVMQPVSQNTNGILGLHIIGYKNTAGGKSQVYCKLLSSLAHSTQTYTPSAGDLWNITNRNSGTTRVDWDADGIAENEYTDGHDNWTAGLVRMYEQMDANLLAYNGNNTSRGINTIAGSFILKYTDGLPANFGYKGQLDTPSSETTSGQFRFAPLTSDDDHDYSYGGLDVERGVRLMAWAKQLIRSNPGGTLNARVRGPVLEFPSWGDGNYSLVNELDAIYGLFYWALCQLVGDTIYMGGSWNFQSRPVMIEECFVDIDTNFTEPDPIFTYDDAGGSTGTQGYPTGSLTWATPDFGELGFIRRRGNWLIAANLTDPPAGYSATNIYNPNQQSGGGFTPRNPEDTITPAQFTALETAGVIDPGDVLTEYDPANYVNQRVTDAFIAANPSKWTGFSFGPRQAHPDDANNGGGTYTLANNPAIARNSANNGATVDRSVNYGIGPLEARLWKIN